jgi:dihydroneopterin aldolase
MGPGTWLRIEGIQFKCVIGVTERERQAPQDIVVNLQVKLDVSKVVASDSIQDTVDYRALSKRVIAAGQASAFRLIETLGAHLCKAIFDEFPRVDGLQLEVEKPGALSSARSVRAVIVASRDSL